MKYPYTSNPITDTLLYAPIWLMSCTYDLGTGVTPFSVCNVDCAHTGWRGIKLQPSVLFQAGWGRRVVPRPPCVRWGAITHGFPQNFLFRPWFYDPCRLEYSCSGSAVRSEGAWERRNRRRDRTAGELMEKGEITVSIWTASRRKRKPDIEIHDTLR